MAMMIIIIVTLRYVPFGWFLRPTHLNTGSFPFLFTFLHVQDWKKGWNHITHESIRFEGLVKSLARERHPPWSGQSIAMVTITTVFSKYVPLVLNFKAYSLEYGFISSFFAPFLHIFTLPRNPKDWITSHLNQVDLEILLNPEIMNNTLYDQGSL